MASVNKNFAVEKGLEVGDSALFVDADNNKTGVGKTDAQYTLDVSGTANFDGTLAAGSIGIGSTQPVRNLDVRGSTQLYGELFDLNDESGTTGQVLQSVTGTGVSWTDIAEIQVNAAGTDFQVQYKRTDGNFGGANQLYYNDTTDRVGIGTSAPEFLLQIARPRDDSSNGFVQIGGTFLDSNATVGTGNSVLIADADGELIWSGVPAFSNGQIQYSSDGIMDGADDFHYDNVNDRVGIGTTQPEYKLEVKGTVGIAGTFHDVNDTVGVAGSVLGVDAEGNLRWAKSGAAGTTGQVQFMLEGGDLAGAGQVYYDSTRDQLGIGVSGAAIDFLLHVGRPTDRPDNGFVQIGGTFLDSKSTIGAARSVLSVDDDGETIWIAVPAEGVTGDIQFRDEEGTLGPATNFVYDAATENVGIGSTQPIANLDLGIGASFRIGGPVLDSNNTVGSAGSALISDADGRLQFGVGGAAGLTGEVQYRDENGNLAGATGFVYDDVNDRVGIGSTQPEYLLQVGGDNAQVQIGGTFRDSNDTVGVAGSALLANSDGELVWSSSSAAPPEFNVIFVTEDGDDDRSGNTVLQSKRTIGAACSIAVAGNIIRVTAGVYNEDNPISVPRNVTIDGDDLRNTQIIGTNVGEDLFHVDNGTLLQNMSFIGAANTGAMVAFHPPRENIHTNVSIAASAIYVGSWVGTALTPTAVSYHAPSGVTTFTLANHGLTDLDGVGITTGSLGFTCLSDNNNLVYNHPRATDPQAGNIISIDSVTVDTFTINVGNAGIGTEYVGFITQSPYVRNCTNFVPDSIGMKIDGNNASNLKSMVVDSYTQYNQGGIGVSITNNGYAQLVSIFTICNNVAIYCGSGGQCDLTNSNSSFGDRGLVASGVGTVAYTGELAVAAEFENDTIVVSGLGTNRPFTGQVLYIGELFDQVNKVTVTNPGSGYTSANPPRVTIGDPTGPNGITAEGVAVVSGFGSVTSIELISNGNQYRDVAPSVTIAPPASGVTATATAEVSPLYFTINSATPPSAGISTIVLDQLLPSNIGVGSTVPFAKQSLILASSHSFEYVGSGVTIGRALPQQGGVAVPANSVVSEDGGLVVHTSTDEKGNFTIGAGFIINQQTGTISGDSFNKSIQATLTPLIIALGS